MHKDFNEKIENNFGLHKTDYPCECRLERQQKSFLYSLNKNNRKVLNQMHKDFNEKIENNFGLHKTDYPCECRLERQQKSCDDLRSRIRELETEML